MSKAGRSGEKRRHEKEAKERAAKAARMDAATAVEIPAKVFAKEMRECTGPTPLRDKPDDNGTKKPEPIKASDRAMIRLTAVLAFAAVTQCIVVSCQWDAMKDQLKEMQGTSAQTDRIITEANRISSAQEESLKQSKAALDAAIATSRNDQRAWITVGQVSSASKKDGVMNYTVAFENTGKTPAIVIAQDFKCVVSKVYPLPIDWPEPSVSKNDGSSTGALASGVRRSSELEISDAQVSAILGGPDAAGYIYIDGVLLYRDVFGTEHKTRFCHFRKTTSPKGDNLAVAPTRNGID